VARYGVLEVPRHNTMLGGSRASKQHFPYGTAQVSVAPVVAVLKRYGIAVEINYHTNEPPAEFFRMCIENGIKLSLGSDAHNLYEVGEFYAHLKFLQKIAPDFDLCDLLIS